MHVNRLQINYKQKEHITLYYLAHLVLCEKL